METQFLDKAQILADLWMNYRWEKDFEDFITYNDLGLPLAFALSEEIIERTPQLDTYIEETFALFLAALELEDEGFDSLDDILDKAGI